MPRRLLKEINARSRATTRAHRTRLMPKRASVCSLMFVDFPAPAVGSMANAIRGGGGACGPAAGALAAAAAAVGAGVGAAVGACVCSRRRAVT